jgi:carbon storage regulator
MPMLNLKVRGLGFGSYYGDERSCEMLVLSRHKGEQIRIGDDVTITVIEIRGDNVRLGIDAPKEVAVHRQEVYEAIQREEGRRHED